MNKRNMIVNISGGQVNIAKDNATINAIQIMGWMEMSLKLLFKQLKIICQV